MQVVSPLFAIALPFFAIALKVLDRRAGRPKIEQFQASTAGRSLESNTPSRQFLRPFCGNSTARYWSGFWITSAPFRRPHQRLRARREWRGLDRFAQNRSDAGAESARLISLQANF